MTQANPANCILQFPLLIIVGLLLSSGGPSHADDKTEFFESKIRPVLVEHCYRCHSDKAKQPKGGLRLDSKQGWKMGGDSGPAIVPGKPEESLVLLAINRSGATSEMPPKKRLSNQIVNDFRKWIENGAIDPRKGGTPTEKKKTVDVETGRQFWAFQPRRKFAKGTSIDQLVRPQSPPAAADKLLRRLFLDLIGLPPTLAERQEFLRLYQTQSPQAAVKEYSERLLARKEFGEKWARHWLDVARYADSNGGDFNLTFTEAWRYRNYVIDAFNDDMPYDQFLREQIAGDLLPYKSAQQRNRQLIASGFLMVGAKMLTERDKAKMHLDIADEQLDTIGRAIMGLTLGCARCHDHKFDPIPTADYYAMAGILHSTRTADRVLMNNVNVTGWTDTELLLDDEARARRDKNQSLIKSLEKELAQKRALVQKSDVAGALTVDDTKAKRTGPWRKSTYRPNRIGTHYLATDKGKGPYSITWTAKLPKPGEYELRVSFGGGSGLAKRAPYVVKHAKGETKLTINQTVKPAINGLWHPIGQFQFDKEAIVHLTDKNAGGHVIADAIQLVTLAGAKLPPGTATKDKKNARRNSLSKEIKELETQLAKLRASTPVVQKTMAAQDNKKKRFGDLHIRIRGEPKNLGPKTPRGFLQVASRPADFNAIIPAGESGRVQLAEWLTRDDHPLTARVMANRIWQHLFGRGIVITSDNFGGRGIPPTNPELLDYLAERLVVSNWSMKSLIREIVQSRSYQQSSAPNIEEDNDPENNRLRRQNRRPVTAEAIRDSMLMIAGELDRKKQESPVEKLGVYAIATSGARHESLGKTGELRQRSIYLPVVRGAVPPALAVFDFPNPDLVTGQRATTTVPAQALFMMNSPFVRKMSHSVSSQMAALEISLESSVQQLYRRILVREADDDDMAAAGEYITQQIKDGRSQEQAIASFVQVLFSSTEFRFVE